MVKNLKQDIPELISQAERSLGAARLLDENEYYAEAVSRAYYAMFYAATALLHSGDIAVSWITLTSDIIAQLRKPAKQVHNKRQCSR